MKDLNEIINIRSNEKNKKWQEISNSWIDTRKKIKKNDKWLDTIRGKQIIYTTNDIKKYTRRYEKNKINHRRINLCYNTNDELNLSIQRYCKNNKILPKSNLDILQQKNYIEKGDDEILHSELNYKYINDNFLEDCEFINENEDDGEYSNEINEGDYFDIDKDMLDEINNKPYFF